MGKFKGKFKSKKSNNEDIEEVEDNKEVVKEKDPFKDNQDDLFDGIDEEVEVPKWYEQFKNDNVDDFKPPTEEELINLRIEAQNVLDAETKFYNSKPGKGKKGNSSWVRMILTKGTARDRVAAHVVTIQNSPIHNVHNISSLINMVKAAKKKECVLVMETLSELFLEDLLRDGKKLKSFDKQPLTKLDEITSGCARGRRLRLAAWMFEDKLKDLYEQFIQALENVAKDTIEANRIKAVSTMYNLLSGHPEKEQLLLQNLINKLGDPSQKVVAKVIYCLTQLLRVHPNMKQIVMDEVEKLLFRPNMNSRTQYYCICFLSQFIFQDKDILIARGVINIYFSFFKASIKKGEVDSRLMGALLMGVKRAYPFAKVDDGSLSQHKDTLYKLVHLTTFNIALHALCLLQQVSSTNDDRFYGALYKKLLDPKLASSCHHAMFINLLYKALAKDDNISRVKAFIKRLFQVCHYMPVSLTCGLLYFTSQLISKRRKDLYSTVMEQQENLSEALDNFGSDEEEVYFDADVDEGKRDKQEVERKPAQGWVFAELNKPKGNLKSGAYNPLVRNPAFANADKTAYLELVQLSHHFHPTVALFAKKILNRELIIYGGDPLSDFTINRFLERFVFKNPKGAKEDDGIGKGPDPQLASRKYYTPQGAKAMNVTSNAYLNQSERQIPVDELFLYKYLKEKHELKKSLKRDEDEDDDDDLDSVASDEFEEMIDRMVGKKNKKLDFLDDIGESLSKKNYKGGEKEDELSENDEEEDVDEDDDEMSDMDDDISGDENEVVEFGSDEEFDGEIDIDEAMAPKKNKSKKESVSKVKNKKRNNDGLEGLFAPAEEFAEILEEAGSAADKPGMISSVQNKDNAAPKQLDWEKKRDLWLRADRNDKRNNKRKMKSKPNFNKRQKNR